MKNPQYKIVAREEIGRRDGKALMFVARVFYRSKRGYYLESYVEEEFSAGGVPCVTRPLFGGAGTTALLERKATRFNANTLARVAQDVAAKIEGLKAISHFAKVYVVTKRTRERIEYARDWLRQHGVLSYVQDVVSSAETTKADICASLGISMLLDDDVCHLEAIQAPGVQRFLLRPRIEKEPLSASIVRVGSWPEFVAMVGSAVREPRRDHGKTGG